MTDPNIREKHATSQWLRFPESGQEHLENVVQYCKTARNIRVRLFIECWGIEDEASAALPWRVILDEKGVGLAPVRYNFCVAYHVDEKDPLFPNGPEGMVSSPPHPQHPEKPLFEGLVLARYRAQIGLQLSAILQINPDAQITLENLDGKRKQVTPDLVQRLKGSTTQPCGYRVI